MIILISNDYSSSYINSDLDIKMVTYLKALKVLCSLLALQVMLRKPFSVLWQIKKPVSYNHYLSNYGILNFMIFEYFLAQKRVFNPKNTENYKFLMFIKEFTNKYNDCMDMFLVSLFLCIWYFRWNRKHFYQL